MTGDEQRLAVILLEDGLSPWQVARRFKITVQELGRALKLGDRYVRLG